MTEQGLSVDALADFVFTTYGLAERPAVTHIRDGQGQSRIFRVQTDAEPLILRLYGPQPAGSPAWIESEAAWLRFLQSHGCHVAAPLAVPGGDLVATLPVAGDSTYAVLFTFAEGTVEWPPTPAQSEQLGATLAHLHQVSDGFTGAGPVRHYDFAELIERPLSRMLPFVEAAEDRAYLQQLGAQIAQTLGAIPQTAPFHGMIHGDVHQGNAHFTSAGELMLFDFTLCGRGWRIYDFAGFLWPLRDDSIEAPGVRTACDHFVAGYQSVRPLDPAELAAIPACVKARDLWEAGDWIATDSTAEPAVLRDWMRTLVARFRQTPL
ncbi:MAG: phosphotransferase [Herpetosiphonaceae bacterium]|nr:phosphotransferase [Herpetosiphonaceae bacterium]